MNSNENINKLLIGHFPVEMSIYPECSAWRHLFAYRGLSEKLKINIVYDVRCIFTDCDSPMGMESGQIPNSALKAASEVCSQQRK